MSSVVYFISFDSLAFISDTVSDGATKAFSSKFTEPNSRPKEFEPDVCIEYFLCDASLKIHDLIAFATKKYCWFWKPFFLE